MGVKSSDVAYGFGQFGSTFLSGDGAKLDLSMVTAKYYVTAITFITATKFGGNGLKMLDGGVNIGLPNTHFISSEVGTVDTDWGGLAGADVTNESNEDSDPIVLDGSGTEFPAGLTIYGMWDYVELHSGDIIAYVAPRPDYQKRA